MWQNSSLAFTFITSVKEDMFSLHLFVCISACQQDDAKTTRPIFMKFGGGV